MNCLQGRRTVGALYACGCDAGGEPVSETLNHHPIQQAATTHFSVANSELGPLLPPYCSSDEPCPSLASSSYFINSIQSGNVISVLYEFSLPVWDAERFLLDIC